MAMVNNNSDICIITGCWCDICTYRPVCKYESAYEALRNDIPMLMENANAKEFARAEISFTCKYFKERSNHH